MAEATTITAAQLNGTGYPSNYLGSVIQSPMIDSSNKPTQRSIKDAQMARDVIKTVIMAGRNRSIINSRILAKYNAERPYDAYKLEAEGLGWRSNFTTKPLPAMIEKVAPRFTTAIDSLKYLTNSSLSSKWFNSTEKTEKFREAITRVIRARKGWKTLLEDIAFNDAIFGHTVVGWLDEYTWFPKCFAQEESFAADGTKSDPRLAQILVLKEVYLPHELFNQVFGEGDSEEESLEIAEAAGYDIKNVREAINKASPIQIRDRLNVGGTLETWYQNALRELTIGASYMAGASVIVVYTLLAREVTGKVSHYRLAGPEMLSIQTKEDRFENMESCVSFYSFQKGNGTLHGSKGIGRDIYELAGMIDRSRNEVVDRLIMSGKTMIQGDIKQISRFKMSIVGSMVIIPNGWQVIEQKMDGNVDPFIKLDAYFQQLVNQLIGSTSPPPVDAGEGMRSPAAWNLLAQREEEGQDVRISRFIEQFVAMMATMQVRLCDKETLEDDAKEMQKELLDIMSRAELDELANSPPAGTVKDLTPIQRQLMIQLAADKKGNPLYNQRQLEVEDVSARIGPEAVEKLLLSDEDPTQQAEQSRMQDLELMLLSAGHPVPVSPRDNHMMHLQVLMPAAQQMAEQMVKGSFGIPEFEAVLAHINEHVNQAHATGVPDKLLKPFDDFVKKIGDTIQKLQALEQQSQQLAAEHVQAAIDPNAPVPPPVTDTQDNEGPPGPPNAGAAPAPQQ
jgi:hypothetical protein